jgi:3',5'-cyclic AMP phosphodiesterase CpdA
MAGRIVRSRMKVSKRTIALIVIIIIFTLIMFKYINSAASQIKSGKEVTFFVATDTHYLAESLTDAGQAFQKFVNEGDGKELNYISEIMDAFANDIKKQQPEILIISGDLTSNGEKKSHLELAKRLQEIEKSGTSVYVIPGNHDILNPYARGFKDTKQYMAEYISDKDFSNIYGSYGYKEAISRDKTTLSYLAAPSEDVWLLMLDTAQYENNEALGYPQLDGRIASGTIDWIKQCSDLAKSEGAQLIAVMHHSLLKHSEVVTEGFTINNSEEAIQLFQQSGIQLALSGHIHLQDIKHYKSDKGSIYDAATACISVYPQKYGILKYSPKNGIEYNTASVDVDGWSKEIGIADKNLNNFRERSRKVYGDRIYSRIVSRLAITDMYSSGELMLMGDIYRTLYLRNYEGAAEIGTEEIKNSPGYKLWLSAGAVPLQRNVLRLVDINAENNNRLYIANDKDVRK